MELSAAGVANVEIVVEKTNGKSSGNICGLLYV